MIRAIVRHGPAVALLTFSLFVFGLLSYATLPREAAPDIKIPYILVNVAYPGTAPADIESLVTIPIENELAGVKDLERMTSTSAEGAAMIFLEFEPDVVIEDALQRVRDRVNRAKADLPDDAEEPVVKEVSMADFPIMIVTIAGDADEERLQALAERLEDEVDRIPGVLDTTIAGGMDREIRVLVDPRRLAATGLGLADVVDAIGAGNVNVPGGEVTAGRADFLVRVPGDFTSAADVERVAIKRRGGSPVFVRDVARVVDGYAERATCARMDGRPAVSLSITKRAGANILDIGDAVKALVARQSRDWPEGVRARILSDRSERIRSMVHDLENNILTALVLVVGVVVFFMGARNSVFVALAIPLSMLLSFVVIDALGMTLNMIVLFSLILALGMLVDNGIVIVENVYRHRELGKSAWEASIDGTAEVAGAVAASTATTVAAFFPLVFWTGIMGEFMGYLPRTVIIVLTASLVVAVVVLPAATARFLGPPRAGVRDVMETRSRVMLAYRRLLEWSIAHRYLSAGLGVATLVFTLVAYGFLNHGTEFFPATDPDRVIVTLREPDGTRLEATDATLRRAEALIGALDNVDVYVAEAGVGGQQGLTGGGAGQPTMGRITVDFLPRPGDAEEGEAVRVEPTPRTTDRIRAAMATLIGVEVEVEKERLGPPVGAPIAVEVAGDDFDRLGALAERIQRRMADIPGVTDLASDYRVGRPELRLRIDRGAARRVGADTRGVANAVRTAIAGAKASTLRDGKDEYDIRVLLDPRFRDDLQDVLALRIPAREDRKPETFHVPLSTVASFTLAGGSGSIRHLDRDRVVTIEGDVAEGFNENAVRAAIGGLLDQMVESGDIPADVRVRLGGADERQREAREFLGRAFLAAVALIAFVLVAQFNSFRLPLIILGTVVLSLVGVLWGLILTGTPFGVIMTGIGVISLAGVVVNNAIVLLDYVERLRAGGMEAGDALVRAGMTRFRPVMLTAITTVLGLVPMALGINVDFRGMRVVGAGSSAQFWGPMAIAVIFGLSLATVLTLVLVPTFYSILLDVDRAWAAVRRRLRGKAGVAALAFLAVLPPRARGAPVTLEQAWQAASGHMTAVKLADEGVVQARATRTQAAALLSPRLSVQGSYTINDEEIAFDPSAAFEVPEELEAFVDPDAFSGEPVVIQEKRYFSGSATLVQPLFDASAPPLLRAAGRNLDAARADAVRARQEARAAVIRAFHGLALARESRRIAEEGVRLAETDVERARRQVGSGALPPRAAIQARLQLAEARRELEQARAAETEAEEAFVRLTGLPRDSDPVLPEADPAPLPAGGEEGLAARLADRPDVRAVDRRAEAAHLQARAERLGWLPTVDGRFTWSYSENTGFSDDPTLWMLVFQANWTLWDGGMRVAQTRSRASAARVAELQAEDARARAEQELRTALARARRADAAWRAAGEQVRLAEENLRQAQARFDSGAISYLELDAARLAAMRAHLALASERTNRELARVDLALALGETP